MILLRKAILLALIAPFLASCPPAHAADKTVGQLTAQTDVQDTDVVPVWRATGPLKKLAASDYRTYVTTGLAATFASRSNNLSDLTNAVTARTNLGLGTAATFSSGQFALVSNNLSDLANVSTARGNLGLGTAAVVNTGASGHALPLLDTANTWGATQTLPAGSTTVAPLSFQAGALLTSATAHAVEWDGSNLYLTQTGPTRQRVAYTTGIGNSQVAKADAWTTVRTITLTGDSTSAATNIDGSANVSIATTVTTSPKWTTGRTETLSGDVTGSAAGINGTANWSVTTTLANTAVTPATYGDSTHVDQVTFDAKGRATGASSVAIATMVGDSGAGGAKGFVPAPVAGDGAARKYLKADGTWGQPFGEMTISGWSPGDHSATLAHGLGVKPVRVEIYLRCLSSQFGHVPGDEVRLAGFSSNNGAEAWIIDSTNVGYVVGSAGIGVVNATTGAFSTVTPSSWSIVVRVWGA